MKNLENDLLNLQKEGLKKIVMNSLEAFEDIGINLNSQSAREVIAVKIASDLFAKMEADAMDPSLATRE